MGPGLFVRGFVSFGECNNLFIGKYNLRKQRQTLMITLPKTLKTGYISQKENSSSNHPIFRGYVSDDYSFKAFNHQLKPMELAVEAACFSGRCRRWCHHRGRLAAEVVLSARTCCFGWLVQGE